MDVRGVCNATSLPHFSQDAQAFLNVVPAPEGRVGRVLFEQLLLPFYLMKERVDLIFSPAFVSPLFGARHKVVTICDMYYRVIPQLIEPFQRTYWRIMIPLSAKRCDEVVTISNNSKIDIERFIPHVKSRTVSIPLASRFDVSNSVLKTETSPDLQPVVLMVANLTANKNCEVIVKAISLLRSQGHSIRFVHAGKDHLGLLARSVEEHGVADLVHSVGKVSDEDLIRLYATSLCTVVPSLYEGFGMPVVEAQSIGTLLICSNSSALPEAAGDGALFFDPNHAEGLASAILRVKQMSWEERQSWIEKGRASAGRFSWQRTARETFAVFERVLEQA